LNNENLPFETFRALPGRLQFDEETNRLGYEVP
jgi:hypothetical protein